MKTIDGQDTYECLACRDTGAVDVFHPETVRRARLRELHEKAIIYTAVARCSCRRAEGRGWMPEFRDTMIPCSGLEGITVAELTALADGVRVGGMEWQA